jgi:hypothetical protein
MAKEMPDFAYEVSSPSYSHGSLTRCKILQHGTDDFTSPVKEVELRTFIAHKKPIVLGRV